MTSTNPQLPTPVFASPDSAIQAELADNAVHLWLLDSRQLNASHQANTLRIMSSDEHERAQKFIRGKEGYIASRWLLRKVLARYTGASPADVRFLHTEKGKPYLPDSKIHFSLSHSGDWVLLAVGKVELLGVDVEAIKTTRDLNGIAESYYHPLEFAKLKTLAGAEHTHYFYRLWTLKEAFLKAIGAGISAGLENVRFTMGDTALGDTINAQIAESLGVSTSEWHFHQWSLSAQDYCALAGNSPQPLQVKWFDALANPAFS
jgi:4'-phosphopantetheinyl transferase